MKGYTSDRCKFMGLCGRSQEEESVIITRKASYQSMNNLYKDLEDLLHTFFLNHAVIYAYTRFDIHAI